MERGNTGCLRPCEMAKESVCWPYTHLVLWSNHYHKLQGSCINGAGCKTGFHLISNPTSRPNLSEQHKIFYQSTTYPLCQEALQANFEISESQ